MRREQRRASGRGELAGGGGRGPGIARSENYDRGAWRRALSGSCRCWGGRTPDKARIGPGLQREDGGLRPTEPSSSAAASPVVRLWSSVPADSRPWRSQECALGSPRPFPGETPDRVLQSRPRRPSHSQPLPATPPLEPRPWPDATARPRAPPARGGLGRPDGVLSRDPAGRIRPLVAAPQGACQRGPGTSRASLRSSSGPRVPR